MKRNEYVVCCTESKRAFYKWTFYIGTDTGFVLNAGDGLRSFLALSTTLGFRSVFLFFSFLSFDIVVVAVAAVTAVSPDVIPCG